MGEHGLVAGDIEREQPRPLLGRGTLMAILCRLLCSEAQRGGRQSINLLAIGHQFLEALGGIEDVVAKLRREFGELLGVGNKRLLVSALQRHAAKHEIAKLVVHDTLLRLGERCPFRRVVLQRLKGFIQGDRLAQAQAQGNAFWLHLVHGIAELLCVFDGLEVGDGTPHAAEAVDDALQGLDDALPGWLDRGLEGVELGVERVEDC